MAAPGFDGLADSGSGRDRRAVGSRPRSPIARSSHLVETLDPTGCGDVFGAAAFARLLAGDVGGSRARHATGLAARNAGFRGASGLASHLRGELVTP